MKNILGVIFHPTKNNKIKKSLLLLTVAFFVGGFFVFGGGSVFSAESVTPVHNTTQDTSYTTIQAAINAADPGDTIEVDAGTYTGHVTINKNLTLKGAQFGVAADDRNDDEAIIEGSFKLEAPATDVIIDGFSFIANSGNNELGIGGEYNTAIYGTVDKVVVQNNIVDRATNEAGPWQGSGAMVHLTGNDLTVQQNVIEQYVNASDSQAIHITANGTALIDNNTTTAAISVSTGDGTNVKITNNTINNAWNEGIWLWPVNTTAELTITGNTVEDYNVSELGSKGLKVDSKPAKINDQTASLDMYNKLLTDNTEVPSVFLQWMGEFGPAYNVNKETFYQTIQDAIDAADNGDTVEVVAGTYEEALIIDKPIILKGAGSGETVIDADNVTLTNNAVVIINASNVTMEGLSVVNGDWGIAVRSKTVSNLEFNDVAVENSEASGFVFENSNISDVTFTDCRADNNGNRGIYFNGGTTSQNVTLTNTSADENQIMGFNNQGTMKNLVISGGTFNNNIGGSPKGTTEGPFYGFGISVEHTTGVDIQGVTTSGNGTNGPAEGGAGIVIKGSSSDVEISGVTLTGNKIGLWIEEGGTNPVDTKIKNSHISGNIDYGVKNGAQEIEVDATLNWWGDISGPAGEGTGTGDAVSENVLFDPWWANTLMTQDSNFVVMEGPGGPINPTPPTGGEVLGEEDETEGEVLGETDSRDYKEQEEEKKEKLEDLKGNKNRLERMKDIIDGLLENIEDEEKENLLREVLEKLNEIEENLEGEIEEYEKSLEEVIEKRVLSEQKERAEKAEEAANKLLDEGDLTEEQRSALEDLLERLQELKNGIEGRLNQ
jgi:hypothetical protein